MEAAQNSVPVTGRESSEEKSANISEAILKILANQQTLMASMAQQLAATQETLQNLTHVEVVLDSLSSNMSEFVYDKENGQTFDAWFSRYSDLFDKDACKLDDAGKVRLLLRKLSPQDHERYNSFILPKLAREFTFKETVEKLKSLFGASISTFRRRYNCLQTKKEDNEDYLAYSCKVNKACVDFKLSELSEEQFKCLIYVCGLHSSRDAEIRMRLINKMNETSDITLQQIVEQCNSLVNLKQDTVLVEKPSTVHYVAHNKRSVQPTCHSSGGSSDREQPRTPCWSCGGMHFHKDCPSRDHKCRDCGKQGHREGYCACFSSKSSNNATTNKPSMKKQWKKTRHQQHSKIVTVNHVTQGRKYVSVELNNVPHRLQIDTGSDISIISHQSWIRIGRPAVKSSSCRAKTASGDPFKLMSELECNITLNGISKQGKFFVTAPNVNLDILGIDMMDLFGLWNKPIVSYCNNISTPSQGVAELQSYFPTVLTVKTGLHNKAPVQPTLKDTPKPVFRPKRTDWQKDLSTHSNDHSKRSSQGGKP